MSDNSGLIEYLGEYVTENKRNKIEKVLNLRTRYITVALEDIYQSQNASAVLRTCDCFGIQEAHVIENDNEYTLNRNVTQGAEQWVDLIRHNENTQNTADCISHLRQRGYQIVATTPGAANYEIGDFPLNQKTALFLGTELDGLTTTVFEAADYTIKIPMYGFTQSFNLSVSAAVILYRLSEKMYKSDLPWSLSEQEKEEIRLRWYRTIINRSDKLEQRYYDQE